MSIRRVVADNVRKATVCSFLTTYNKFKARMANLRPHAVCLLLGLATEWLVSRVPDGVRSFEPSMVASHDTEPSAGEISI